MNIVGGENKEHRSVDKFVSDQMKRARYDLLHFLPVTSPLINKIKVGTYLELKIIKNDVIAMKLFFVQNDHVSLYTMKPFRIQKTIVLRSIKLYNIGT